MTRPSAAQRSSGANDYEPELVNVREVMSAGEARFELWRRRSGLVLAPIFGVLMWILDLGLDQAAHRLAAILAAVVVLWVTEAIPMAMTAFLGVAAAVVLGVAPARQRSRRSPTR